MRNLGMIVRKLLAMPLRDIWIRFGAEFGPRFYRLPPGVREDKFGLAKLLKATSSKTLAELNDQVQSRKMPWDSQRVTQTILNAHDLDLVPKVIERAEAALGGWVCLMGSGPVQLGRPENIDWHKDHISGLNWAFDYFYDLDPVDIDRPSDVKFPWELSRMQWLLPVAQAWHLTGDERYADHLRAVLESWMKANPTAWGINWSCTMEPAMRVIAWCWLYQMVCEAPSWKGAVFRQQFLVAIYLHVEFVRRNLEISDINGNHLIADAAALVIGGTFLGGSKPIQWRAEGWRILKREIVLQVYPDGVNFEGSVPYHRLVAELFHLAGVTEERNGGLVPKVYRDRLLSMANYTEAYTRPDGLAPVWGDNDDGRSLPLGGQAIGDHRYLPELIRAHWDPLMLSSFWKDSADECLWWWGEIPEKVRIVDPPVSMAFSIGGSYILRSEQDYVFFDCGPLGLADRGGHGHNDMLAFEAVLNGVHLVSDPGCPVYSGDWKLRNYFRSTKVHSTPQVADAEINRFISPKNLWSLHGDAKAELVAWKDTREYVFVRGSHSGYERLNPPIQVQRTLLLNKENHALIWCDELNGVGDRAASVTLQLANYVQVISEDEWGVHVRRNKHDFRIDFIETDSWSLSVNSSMISPQYGILIPALCLLWEREKRDSANTFTALIYPGSSHSIGLVNRMRKNMSALAGDNNG
jgi:hypothetical protein